MNIKELVIYLENKGCDLAGCSRSQVAKIEEYYNVKLPAAYIEFLLAMGKKAGDFMKGSSVFYDEIFDLREGSVELLNEDNFKELPEDAFVFWIHQGYQFAFFYINAGDNPPVYSYYEGRTSIDFEFAEKSFTDFLQSQLVMSGLMKDG